MGALGRFYSDTHVMKQSWNPTETCSFNKQVYSYYDWRLDSVSRQFYDSRAPNHQKRTSWNVEKFYYC